MKSKDWTIIALIVVLSAVFSMVVSSFMLGGKLGSTLKVEVVSPITSDFPLPNSTYFNSNSINPTQEIQIGSDNNQSPFNGQ